MKPLVSGASGVLLLVTLLGPLMIGPASAQGDGSTSATATRASELAEIEALRTEVADLRTRVAQLPPSPTVAPTTAATPVLCGRPFESWGLAVADDIAVQVLRVEANASVPAATPPAGTRYLVAIEVAIENRGRETLLYHPEDFRLTDCRGEVVAATASGVEPAIADGRLAPGAAIRGWITFALPDAAQPKQFVYQIREERRGGALVRCELVDTSAPPSASDASGGKGCSAVGGHAAGRSRG